MMVPFLFIYDLIPCSGVLIPFVVIYHVQVDLEEPFRRFGTIRHVWVARNPAGFGFVDFEVSLPFEQMLFPTFLLR